MTNGLIEFGDTVKAIPTEMVQWWRDSHRWDRPRYVYATEYVDGLAVAHIRSYDPDYLIWHRLGRLSDALLVVILLLIILMIL